MANGWKHSGSIIVPTITDDLLFWRRYGRAGLNDADSIARCARNQAPDHADDVATTLGTPVVEADWLRMSGGGNGYETDIMEPDEFTMYAVCRTQYPTVGDSGAERAFVAGWYGGGTDLGSAFVFHSTGAIRGLAYPVTGGLVASSATISTNSQDEWRIVAVTADQSAVVVHDLTDAATGSTGTLTDGKRGGLRPFRVGVPYAGFTVCHVDIQAVVLYSAVHDSTARASVVADLRAGLADTSITEGEV